MPKGSKKKKSPTRKLDMAITELNIASERLDAFYAEHSEILDQYLLLQEERDARQETVKAEARAEAERLGSHMMRERAGYTIRTQRQERRTFNASEVISAIDPNEWPEMFTVKASQFDMMAASGIVSDEQIKGMLGEPKIVYQTVITKD